MKYRRIVWALQVYEKGRTLNIFFNQMYTHFSLTNNEQRRRRMARREFMYMRIKIIAWDESLWSLCELFDVWNENKGI